MIYYNFKNLVYRCYNNILLLQNLRTRIGEAGYNTIVYTGTYGVLQLRDSNNQLVDIYLQRDSNNNTQLPVPLYYYKVRYEVNLINEFYYVFLR